MTDFIPQPPVIIKEKVNTSNADLAQIIKAAGSSSRELSSVEFRQKESTLRLEAHHIAYASLIVGICAFAVAWLLGLDFWPCIGVSAIAGFYAGVILLWFAGNQLANVTEYYIAYEATNDGVQIATQRTFKIELRQANQLRYVELPEWFTEVLLLKLATLADRDGFSFNRPTLEHSQIATQAQFPELRDGMIKAELLEKFGRGYQLTDNFFALADSVARG